MKQGKMMLCVAFAALVCVAACAQAAAATGAGGGYLFAHMRTGREYGHLYFDVSRDGITWTQINGGREIPLAPAYLGHPYITEDDHGEFYLIGTTSGKAPHDVVVWRSRDLVRWSHVVIDKSHLALPEGFVNDTYWYGAVKIFFDRPSRQFMLTWHAERASTKNNTEKWESMRTFYVLTRDFKTFTKAAPLFDCKGEDAKMAQIDTSVHFHQGAYYAIVKDERWEKSAPGTYKSIRLAKSKSLTGPWSPPGVPLTPHWREAPSLVPSPDGQSWHLYAEEYPRGYRMYKSASLDQPGPWREVPLKYEGLIRHGCVIRINEAVYRGLLAAAETFPAGAMPVPKNVPKLPAFAYIAINFHTKYDAEGAVATNEYWPVEKIIGRGYAMASFPVIKVAAELTSCAAISW
ncbi:MAG: glycosyl hydrolase family 32 [Kiritimatiellae bacterium]|nr:glycosyl hydrolase family 32 [Kiritimatiellia bacterium]